jgi:hypothetical protein
VPAVVADYLFNQQTQLWNIGEAPSQTSHTTRAAKWMGCCGGNDIKVGCYDCSNFGTRGHTIYNCVEDPSKCEGMWLKFGQTCL